MTREKAIKKFELQLLIRSNGYYDHLKAGGKQDIAEEEHLEAMTMAIAALREQPRWIPVTERLPADERKVLVYYGFDSEHNGNLGMMFVGTLTYFCFDSNPHWQHSSSCNIVVTHWMPLPSPPEVET